MAPNCKGEKLPITECAAPFKDEENGSGVAKPNLIQNGNPSAFVSLRREENRAANTNLRVKTIHRFTYELDRYQKNAMLIFHYDNVYNGSRETANKVRSTFEQFRFEVEVYHNATRDEVKAINKAFFLRDFREYGAVGIVIIAKVNRDGMFTTPGSNFFEKDILDYMVTASLRTKPKILISACEFMPRSIYFSHIAHIMQAHVQTSTEANRICNPLSLFCDELLGHAEQEILLSVLLKGLGKVNRNLERSLGFHGSGDHLRRHFSWQIKDRMLKKLYLCRSSNNNTN